MLDEEFNAYDEEQDAGRPTWFRCWCEKYANALDIYNLNNDLTQEERGQLFAEVGSVFANAMLYFLRHDEEYWRNYKPRTRDGRILWNLLKADIDKAYRDYAERVRNGKKGGRPPKNGRRKNQR